MKRVGIFMEVSNLYFCISKKFRGRKLDYKKFYSHVEDLGKIVLAYAYGSQKNKEASGFLHCLKQAGFTPKYGKPKIFINGDSTRCKADHDVDIVIDVVDNIDKVDLIILGTADGDLLALVNWIRRQGKEVVVFATNISKDLKRAADDYIEIPKSLLEDSVKKDNTTV